MNKTNIILYITTSLGAGGGQKFLYDLLSKIDRDRFTPMVVSLMGWNIYGEGIAALDIPVYSLNMKQGIPTPQALIKLAAIVRQIKPHIIQGWMYHGNLAATFAKWLANSQAALFWSIHHSVDDIRTEKLLTQAVIKLGALLSRYTNLIVYVSQTSQLQHHNLGYFSVNNTLIPNGFNTDCYQPSSANYTQFRQALHLPSDAFLIGSIARYHPMKDHANFLKAAALLLAKVSEVHFVMVGTAVDVNNQDLTRLIEDLGIKSQVHLLGERRDIDQITPALDIMTSASAYGEAFPLVIGEAMSCSVPCVVTDVGDSAWIVGDTGYIVEPKNAEALANAWAELIDLGTEARQVMGQRARDKIEQSFAIEAIVARYESLYTEYLRR